MPFLYFSKNFAYKCVKKILVSQCLREFSVIVDHRFLFECRSDDARDDGPVSRNCTKHYPGSLPGVLSRVLLWGLPLCIYRRGYLRAPHRLLITISTTVFHQENGESAIWKTNGRMFPYNYILFEYNRTSLG